ncbi:MAG: glycosyl transferase family 28 [Methylococcales bacterium]|nr:glycosyl transferase family 28 [Methylococcales bacterium]
MIFVTVGSQLPFDRLIKTIDQWAETNYIGQKIFAQIGKSGYTPKNIDFSQTISPDNYNEHFTNADLIIAHAGMGTIISALEHGKLLIILPRLACNGEHRNDHQLATSKHFSNFENIYVVNNENELLLTINNLVNQKTLSVKKDLKEVSSKLISVIKQFISD